jgi:hypothetical protein
MALTRDQIINSSDILDTVTKQWYLVLFKANDEYRKNAWIFSNTETSTRLDAANSTIKARMLNALAKKIDELGTGVVEIRGDKDAVWWAQYKERNDLVTEALHVLYDFALEGIYIEDGIYVNTGIGLYGTAAVGQRGLPCDICTQFMCNGGSCGCSSCH